MEFGTLELRLDHKRTNLDNSKVLKQGQKFLGLVRGEWNSKTLTKSSGTRPDLTHNLVRFLDQI